MKSIPVDRIHPVIPMNIMKNPSCTNAFPFPCSVTFRISAYSPDRISASPRMIPMFVTFVSAAFPLFAAIVPTESDTSALSISSPPGSMRKKTKATIGPNISDRPASRFTAIVPICDTSPM